MSLPSYFVHEQYAGISSFINQPADEAERNAQMFAVGVLVPLSFGRLGKSWRHAPRLKELAEWVEISHVSKYRLTCLMQDLC
jgi:hypothetical protein